MGYFLNLDISLQLRARCLTAVVFVCGFNLSQNVCYLLQLKASCRIIIKINNLATFDS